MTLIARPRRFGKTLNMSMLEQFFSIHYADRGNLFEGLSIWNEENYRKLQGTYPVISISFARVKESDFEKTKAKIYEVIRNVKTSFDVVTSNRESGFGRYDVVIEPKDIQKDAIIMEFKVHDAEDEKTLEDTVKYKTPHYNF